MINSVLFGNILKITVIKMSLTKQKVMRQADRDSDMDERDKYSTEMDLLRKHAEQKVAVMQGENIQLDDELEEVRIKEGI